MPHFLLTFGDASQPPVGAVIIEATSMFRARMTAVVRRLAPDVPFGEGLKLTAEMMAQTPSRLAPRSKRSPPSCAAGARMNVIDTPVSCKAGLAREAAYRQVAEESLPDRKTTSEPLRLRRGQFPDNPDRDRLPRSAREITGPRGSQEKNGGGFEGSQLAGTNQ